MEGDRKGPHVLGFRHRKKAENRAGTCSRQLRVIRKILIFLMILGWRGVRRFAVDDRFKLAAGVSTNGLGIAFAFRMSRIFLYSRFRRYNNLRLLPVVTGQNWAAPGTDMR